MSRVHRRLLCYGFGAAVIASLLGCGSAPNEAGQQASETKRSSTVTESPRKPVVLTVAAASDLKFALDEIIADFQAAHADITLKVTYGSSGNLFAQMTNDAPFDLFLAADIQYARDLAQQGQGVQDTVFPYAVGYMVVWVPKRSELDVEQLGIRTLLDGRVKKIAIANPKHAPYGRAAEAALKSLGVYEPARERLVLGENIAQTAQFVDSGAADVGLIALSLALAPSMKGQGRFWQIPPDAHPPLLQGGVILSRCQHPAVANEFKAYLIGPEGRRTLQKYGFGLPGE